MKLLVTGGAGFIGSHLVDHLLRDKQNHVIVIDSFDPFYDRTLKESNIKNHVTNVNYKLIKEDIFNRVSIEDVFKIHSPDIVVHLAAKAGVRSSLEDPKSYIETNINGTSNLLELSVKYQVKKFIFASSSSVYGLNSKVPFAESDPILQQASPYGATKTAGEALCRSFSNCFGLQVFSLRFFTVYGPRQRPDLAIHSFSKKILKNEIITLFGDGSSRRDYTYIDDIIYGITACIRSDSTISEVFNLGSDQPISLIELVRMLEQIFCKKAIINWAPDQVGEVPVTWADLSKSRKILKYNPTTTLENGLLLFRDWLTGNQSD